MDIHKIFEYALQREFEGKRFFEENAERLSHAAAVGAFKSLAQEEQKHIIFIQNQLDALGKGKSAEAAGSKEMEAARFFADRAQSELLEQTVAEAMVADLPVLRMAYLIERDFAEFYEMAAKKSSGEAQKALEMLAKWERTHEELFKNLHDAIFEKYAQMPWGG
ncbi:MAG: ferritin family protein [Chloroflexota bacterium]